MDPGWAGSWQHLEPWLCPSRTCMGGVPLSVLVMSCLPSLPGWQSIPVSPPQAGYLEHQHGPNPALFFQKCVHYWPQKEGTYGPFTIRVQGLSDCTEYMVRDLSIQVGSSCILGAEGELSRAGQCPQHPQALWQEGTTVRAEQRVHGSESWILGASGKGGGCRAPACPRRSLLGEWQRLKGGFRGKEMRWMLAAQPLLELDFICPSLGTAPTSSFLFLPCWESSKVNAARSNTSSSLPGRTSRRLSQPSPCCTWCPRWRRPCRLQPAQDPSLCTAGKSSPLTQAPVCSSPWGRSANAEGQNANAPDPVLLCCRGPRVQHPHSRVVQPATAANQARSMFSSAKGSCGC